MDRFSPQQQTTTTNSSAYSTLKLSISFDSYTWAMLEIALGASRTATSDLASFQKSSN
ncbi:hypothetical protein YC2023_067786 [Brassica napus]